jgi:hypothetical protein
MKRGFRLVATLVSIFSVTAPFSSANFVIQDFPASQSSAASQAPDESATSNDANTPAEPKKAKKVWTNENLTDVSGSAISQIGDAKNGASRKSAASKPVSSQVIASYRKQLAAFQAELTDLDKQIADLKSFSKGESAHTNGLQMHKSYTMEPVQDQVSKLEAKRKILAARMDSVFDAARKRGIEPGQLR